jgi:hypothetical protein
LKITVNNVWESLEHVACPRWDCSSKIPHGAPLKPKLYSTKFKWIWTIWKLFFIGCIFPGGKGVKEKCFRLTQPKNIRLILKIFTKPKLYYLDPNFFGLITAIMWDFYEKFKICIHKKVPGYTTV